MENLIQGLGVFACVGALLLAGLVFFVFRALSRGARNAAPPPNTGFEDRGVESPRYDDRDVVSTGGFGGIPATGTLGDLERNSATRDLDRDGVIDSALDRDRDLRLPGDPDHLDNIPLDRDINPNIGSDTDMSDRYRTRDRDRDRRDDDDDNIRSSGGFGG